MYAFKYQRAESVGAANAALSADDSAKVLSGGMTLLPSMKHRLAAPTALIDVARLPEMIGVRQEGDHWWIGAATRHQDVAAHVGLQQAMPGLATLAGLIGDPQVRARHHWRFFGQQRPQRRLPCSGLGLASADHHRSAHH